MCQNKFFGYDIRLSLDIQLRFHYTLKPVSKTFMEVSIILKFFYQFCLPYWKIGRVLICVATAFLIGCSQKTSMPETPQRASLTGTIVEIDDHGNAVTDLEIAPFTERGWKLGDTLEATFATGQKIEIKFVENYGDVPVGDYLGRFSTSTKQFKIAINMGNITEVLKLENQSKVVLQKVETPASN